MIDRAACLTAVATLALLGAGCSSLRVVEGPSRPPPWIAEPASSTNHNPDAFSYASGVATYALRIEDGLHAARHDAIRKLAESVGVEADNVYRTQRTARFDARQDHMPNVPQFILNSRRIAQSSARGEKSEDTPQSLHVSRTILHGVEQDCVEYTIWRYRPGLAARLIYGDTPTRFYDVYVLMRCPRAEIHQAVGTARDTPVAPPDPSGAPDDRAPAVETP